MTIDYYEQAELPPYRPKKRKGKTITLFFSKKNEDLYEQLVEDAENSKQTKQQLIMGHLRYRLECEQEGVHDNLCNRCRADLELQEMRREEEHY